MEYFDKHGKKIEAGMSIKHDDGEVSLVYEADRYGLGLNASNESHRSFHPATRELYPLSEFNLNEFEIVEQS